MLEVRAMSSFINVLSSADRWLLLKINREWTTPWLDAFMPAFTDLHKVKWFAFCVGPAALGAWLWLGGRRALKILLVAGVAVVAGDLISYRILKPWAARPRPIRPWVDVERRAPGTWNGFPSNHAVNAGAAASVLSIAYPALTPVFAGYAVLMAYSRVYVGVHYPGDVLAGLALGAGIGWPWAVIMLGGPGRKKRKK
jgi:undecaprenyl-diphosphatase